MRLGDSPVSRFSRVSYAKHMLVWHLRLSPNARPHPEGDRRTREVCQSLTRSELCFTHPKPERAVMQQLKQAALKFLSEENGPTAVEYAVMLALIIVVCLTAITALGTNANNTFSYVGTKSRVGS